MVIIYIPNYAYKRIFKISINKTGIISNKRYLIINVMFQFTVFSYVMLDPMLVNFVATFIIFSAIFIVFTVIFIIFAGIFVIFAPIFIIYCNFSFVAIEVLRYFSVVLAH